MSLFRQISDIGVSYLTLQGSLAKLVFSHRVGVGVVAEEDMLPWLQLIFCFLVVGVCRRVHCGKRVQEAADP